MTPLGLNTAAVPEAAALFPLAAAAPAAADDSAAAAGSFGDLLAASFGETPVKAGGDDAPAPKGVSMADTWFAKLNIDFTALNANLEAEETAAPSITVANQTASPINDADADKCAADVDDENAGALLMALTVPAQVPAPLSEPLPATASAPSDAPTTSLSGLPSVPCDATTAKTQAPGSNIEPASSDQPSELSLLTPPVNLGKAGAEEVGHDEASLVTTPRAQDTAFSQPKPAPATVATTAEVKPAASALDISGGDELPAPDARPIGAPVADAPAVRPNAPRGAAVAHAPERQPEAPVSEVASTPQASVAEPQQPQGPTIDVTPANGRTREPNAARLAELSGFGQGGGSGPTAAAITGQAGDSPSQSHTQDGSANEAFALGVQENAVASRPADGGSAAPVFSIAQPAASAAAPAVTHAPDVSPAPAFTSVPDPQNVGRMIESMRVQIKEGIQEATVHLKPEHLGEVTISVRVERGAVSAIVHTDTPAVQQWLEAQEGKLRSGLSDQGLHLERFYVHRDGSQERREQPRQQSQTAQRYRQQRDDSAVRFEVLV